MDRAPVDIYEGSATEYGDKRRAYRPDRARAFADAVPAGGWRLELGCGPGHYLPHLDRPVVAADAAVAMVAEARRRCGDVPGGACDLEALPFRRGAVAGVWASKCLQHVAPERLPLALGGLHRVLPVGGVLDITMFAGDGVELTDDDDDFPGRRFTWWQPERLHDVLVGAGFELDELQVPDPSWEQGRVVARARRARTLPDTVGPGMRVLVCGLNPSVYAADVGVGYARPGNRFWPAARAAGLVECDRDAIDALARHGMGMTDLVKRATTGASGLTAAEYRDGAARVERLVRWLRPGAACFVGLAGWRAAVDPHARSGEQEAGFGGVPAYVMPSTSGANAHARLDELADHLRAAVAFSR